MEEERTLLLEEEYLIVRHSGEIPEIALYSTLYYLSEDPEGPHILLNNEELAALQNGALKRSREIVLRDLDPANRDLSLYRGVQRSLYNWRRHQAFCERIGRDGDGFKEVVRAALLDFFRRELEDVDSGNRTSSINCTAEELAEFAAELGCIPENLPSGWQMLCLCAP
ncbi:MAG: hypothetical protein L3J49_00725 [Desulfobulbaceae bacterium]|nr:hypothetical protein [Desulfobulbaceae bacterium]